MLTIAAIVIALYCWPITLCVLAVIYWPFTLCVLAVGFVFYVLAAFLGALGKAAK